MEIEAKFALNDKKIIRRLKSVRKIAGYALAPGETKRVRDTYLDTQERALLVAGYACRQRKQDDGTILLTLKEIATADGAIHRREELEAILSKPQKNPRKWMDIPARDFVLGLVGKARLVPLFEIRQTRVVRAIQRDQQLVAEMSIDQVAIHAGEQKQTLVELEIELKTGAETDLVEIANCLRDEWHLAPESQSKFERALALLDRDAKPARKSPDITLDDSMADAARKTLLFHFERMIKYEAGTRKGDDIEELHDMRVATRRMRAALRVFAPYLDSAVFKPFAKQLRRLGRTLGAARDLDVFHEKTQAYLATLPADRQSELDPLRAAWQAEQDRARDELNAYLDSETYLHFKDEFRQFLQTPGAGAASIFSKDDLPLAHRVRNVLPGVLFQDYAAVRAFDEYFTGDSVPLARYHQLRIASKGLRYTLEFFQDALPTQAQTQIDRVKQLQDHLGNLQDATVACDVLRGFLTWGAWRHDETSDPVQVVAPGVAFYLAVRQQEIKDLVENFHEVWSPITSQEFSRELLGLAAW